MLKLVATFVLKSVFRKPMRIVAAHDSGWFSKLMADFVCSGKSDETTIQAAIDALPDGEWRPDR